MSKEKKWNKATLAARLNTTRQTLYAWETDKPELVYLINLGLIYEEQMTEMEAKMEQLKTLQKTKKWKFSKES